MGLKMAEYEPVPVSEYFSKPNPSPPQNDTPFLPYWARCRVQCAQNLLDCSNEPIEYDHDDEDYSDNCFFFPEDCSWTPPKDWVVEAHCQSIKEISEAHTETDIPARQETTDTMIPGLPDIKMLDSEALGDLLEDNLSPPEITSILYVSCFGLAYAVYLPPVTNPGMLLVSSPPTAPSSPTHLPSHPVNCAISAPLTAPHTHATQRTPRAETSPA